MLGWSVTGATTLSIDQGVGIVTGANVSVSPDTTTTYTLTATNSGGAATTAPATVTVKAPLVDLQVSASGMLDPEFDPYSNRYTYIRQTAGQTDGKLWVGTFAPDGTLTDFNAQEGAPLDDGLFQINGPEWGRDSSGSVISYVKNDLQGNRTLACAHEDAPGVWSIHTVPNLPVLPKKDNAVYPSDNASNQNARVYFNSMAGVEWRDLGTGEGGLVTPAPNYGFWRWGSQSNYIAFIQTPDGTSTKQLYVLDTDTGLSVQVSSDAGDKNVPHMWEDANWGWVVSGVVGNNCQVYQYPSGTKLVTIPSPNGKTMQSVEHFVYQGKSYIYYYVSNDGVDGTKNNDVYISSVETNYKHLKVSGDALMNRFEPEVAFPSPGTPIIFFSADGADGGNNALWRPAIVGLP